MPPATSTDVFSDYGPTPDLWSDTLRVLPFVVAALLLGFSIWGISILIAKIRRVRYQSAGPLLTATERSFYGVLCSALPPGVVVMCKVRLADLVQAPSGMSGSRWRSAFNRVCAKHVDFTLCDAQTLQVVGVVELDDRSHLQQKRKERDRFVDVALKDAGIAILRQTVLKSYSPKTVREQVIRLIVECGS